MTGKIFLLSLAVLAVSGADDPWTKVRELKSGTEIRVFKKGSKVPVIGKLDQATEDAVVVMLKKEEIGIEREEIDRIDSRATGGSRVTHTTTNSAPTNPAKLPPLGPRRNDERPDDQTSSGSSVSIGSRPDFETVYTRPAHK